MACSPQDFSKQAAGNQISNDSKAQTLDKGNNQAIYSSDINDIPQVNPLPGSKLSQYQQCQSDNDCTYVNNGCCDCANSGSYRDSIRVKKGEEIAINANKINEFKAEFNCSDVSCTQLARIPNCGNGFVRCKNNQCNFTLIK